MCDLCDGVARLAADTVVDELRDELIRAEVAAGWSVPGARRPLHRHEVTAHVRFGDLERAIAGAGGRVYRHAAGVRDQLLDALANDLTELATTGSPLTILDRIRALADPSSGAVLPGVARAVDDAAATIEADLLNLSRNGARGLAAENARQARQPAPPPTGDDDPVSDQARGIAHSEARRVAAQPVARLLTVAERAAARAASDADPIDVVDAVITAAESASDAGTADVARQAANRAHGAGRAQAAATMPEPREVYASELMDRDTCRPCGDVDGRTYTDLAAALVDYPDMGGYVACAGGGRCRGTLVLVWGTESPPTLDDPGDRPPPAIPTDRTPRGPVNPPPAPEPAVDVNDLDGMDDDTLEAALHAATSRGDFDTAERYGDELDRRAGAQPLTEVDEQALVPTDADLYRAPDDDWDAPIGLDDTAPTDDEIAAIRAAYEEHMNATGGVLAGGTEPARASRAIDRVRDEWDNHTMRTSLEIERYLRGASHISRARAVEATDQGITLLSLLTGPIDRALYYASEDLWRWWVDNPRLSFAEYALGAGVDNATMRQRAEAAARARDEAMARYEEDPDARAQRRRDRDRRRRRGQIDRGGDTIRNRRTD
ncbi:hypothetical protein [Jiangella muralis]|uniref:hypothetical protein n=1 Tax=Jiangella muralis TaxID=702383 RepID=UPI00069DDEC8|nr:hypothetical protein [Jiangella muralis]